VDAAVREEVSTYYLGVNRGKRSIALDLRDETDAGLARELAGRADVVIENFKPAGCASTAWTPRRCCSATPLPSTARSAASGRVRVPRSPATT
jgi:crotonobetainyl-CoA:carnitine CoA-transferase CaiB-like acyl-CoA transferase